VRSSRGHVGPRLHDGEMTSQADNELWPAIGDPSRCLVLDLLVSNGEVSASWLAGRVPVSRQAVSKHLVVLERSGRAGDLRRRRGADLVPNDGSPPPA
jgi:DNA-binding transcriptional ArsR family regulator